MSQKVELCIIYAFKINIVFPVTSILDDVWVTFIVISLLSLVFHHLPLLPKITIKTGQLVLAGILAFVGLACTCSPHVFHLASLRESDCRIVFPGPDIMPKKMLFRIYIPNTTSVLSKTKYLLLPLGPLLPSAKHFHLFKHFSTISRNMITNPYLF